MTARIKPLIARFKAEMAADKKRATVLGVLLLVLVGVTGRLLIGGKSPETVVAQPALAVAGSSVGASAVGAVALETPLIRPTLENPAPAPSVGTPAVPVSPDSVPAQPQDVAKTPAPVEIEPGPKQVTRDLFASAAWSSFPSARRTGTTQPADEDEAMGGFWTRIAANLADRGVEQRIELQRIEALAQELRVEATMSGDTPAAYISGRLVHVGDTIRSFSVVSIDERCVTLALDGHHVRLRIP